MNVSKILKLIKLFIKYYSKLKKQILNLNLKCILNIHLIFINNCFYLQASLKY